MKAKKVYEFQKGLNPYDTMGIGREKYYKDFFPIGQQDDYSEFLETPYKFGSHKIERMLNLIVGESEWDEFEFNDKYIPKLKLFIEILEFLITKNKVSYDGYAKNPSHVDTLIFIFEIHIFLKNFDTVSSLMDVFKTNNIDFIAKVKKSIVEILLKKYGIAALSSYTGKMGKKRMTLLDNGKKIDYKKGYMLYALLKALNKETTGVSYTDMIKIIVPLAGRGKYTHEDHRGFWSHGIKHYKQSHYIRKNEDGLYTITNYGKIKLEKLHNKFFN
jgi:hypothetical protein